MTEVGYPADVISANWTGLFAPAGTNPAVVRTLNEAVNAGLHAPATEEGWRDFRRPAARGSPADLTNLVAAEIQEMDTDCPDAST